MKLLTTFAACIFATSLFAAELPAPSSVVERDSARFLVPIAGDVIGAQGEHFRTDLTIVNFSDQEQIVEILWIPRQGAGEPVSEFINVPNRSYITHNDVVGGLLGMSGVGSLLVSAVDGSGNLEEDGEITGFARIYANLQCIGPG